jgi:hypothetical protein
VKKCIRNLPKRTCTRGAGPQRFASIKFLLSVAHFDMSGASYGRREPDHVVGNIVWADGPVPFCFGWRHDLAVVVEDHPRRRMSHFQGELRCVLMFGEVIGGERMPQPVVRPMGKPDFRGKVPNGDVIGSEGAFAFH